jgi:GT2 family glycosyltransferase
VLGAAVAFRRDRFEIMGGFDESFFMYFEEVDLCYRLSKADQQIHFVPMAEIVHVGGASTDQQRVEMKIQYFTSLAQFYRKHYSGLNLAILIPLVEAFALLWLARDRLSLMLARDAPSRSRLHENVNVSERLLLGTWSGNKDPRRVVPV